MLSTKRSLTILGIIIVLSFLVIKITGSSSSIKTKMDEETIQHSYSIAHSLVQPDSSSLIFNLIKENPYLFNSIIDSLREFEIQVIYTQINRDASQKPAFRQYSLNVDNHLYFNPASLVKLPVMLLALDKINRLKIDGLTKFTRMEIEAVRPCQNAVVRDTFAPAVDPSIAHYCKKIMLASDNDGYNRLYEFLGQRYINHKIKDMGCHKSLIIQRFNNCSSENNRYTNPMRFIDKQGNLVYSQPEVTNKESYINPLGKVIKGKGYYLNDKFINEPKDFTYSNNFPLQEVHDMFLGMIFSEAYPENHQLELSHADYVFLLKYMAMYPRESVNEGYKRFSLYADNLKKYFMWGSTYPKITESNIRTFNVPGQSFGYLSDCAYIVDFDKNIEFILLAVINTNPKGIYNTPYYRYSSLGLPFLENLSRTIYNYELKRNRKYKPDLSALKQTLTTN